MLVSCQQQQADFVQPDLACPLQFLPPTPLAPSATQPQFKDSCSRNEVKDDEKENLLVFQRTDHREGVRRGPDHPLDRNVGKATRTVGGGWLSEVNFQISSHLGML